MRTQPGSSTTGTSNSSPEQTLRAGGKWFKKFWRSPTGQPNSPSSTDGHQSPTEEERPVVTPTFEECLEGQYLFEATQLLIDREKHLFGEITEADALKAHEEAVEKLAADYEALEKRLEQMVQQSLSLSSEEEVSALTSAVKAINLEEEQDQLWGQRCRTPPAWRPKKWKEHHDKVLHELVYSRLENPSSPTGGQVNQSSIQSDLMIYIGRVLDEAKKEWDQGKEPRRDDGCYASPVAYDVIQLKLPLICQSICLQFIYGIVTSVHITVRDRHKAQEITSNLTDFMQRYQKFHEDIMRQNKPHSKAFIKANLSCVEKFRDFLVKHDLFPEDVRENCLQVLTEMKQSAHTYLLTPVHKILKPHYQKVGTSDWLKKNTFEKLLNSTEDELQELQGSSQSCHQELIGRLQQEMTVEYVRRLLKGEVKLKDKDRQQKAYMTVKENAERLHELFARMGSTQDWLKEILTNIAEVLKLQDIPAIQMEIVSLGSAYPDLSEKHVSALLKLKTNLSKADKKIVKTTLSDTLKESRADPGTRKFFSKIEVR
ncbi:tumor necrosis factor alpha-induced protein 2-like [Neolamprologus brichardi]|uniref:tumor necrosis factor alpha-induced protein 2-like n=1 Tax=Neolamprologus brichardi TaxID=32507 RepID=UPI001643A709|nr:tumor necrosis factor alpha-induced protein 2-like [Neolamprologus brichardi]